jgi:exopolyphosphatase/guanosine-5'-triphosphate,3'-diphosphate pyrophosphatase
MDDRAAVAAQLERQPRSPINVVARCPLGISVVIEVPPHLDDGTPFPTTYWLTCPLASRRIGRIESAGGVKAAERRLEADPELTRRHETTMTRYATQRDARVDESLDRPRPSGGVAGAVAGVKCLHAHYADYAAGNNNVVGEWTAAEIDPLDCAIACVATVDGTVVRNPQWREPKRPPRQPSRVAAIDIGTNTVRLLVADSVAGRLEEVTRHVVITRLGQEVDRTGVLHPDAIERTLGALREYGTIMDELAVGRRRAVATSATRDAANAGEFLDAATAVLGVRPEVIDGPAEARLSFLGTTSGINDPAPNGDSVLVIDIGGGSTEFVVGVEEPVYSVSVDIGSVRLTERHLGSSPPTAEMIASGRRHVADLFQSELELPPIGRVIGVAGTYTTLAAAHLDLAEYDRAAVDGTVLTGEGLRAMVEQLATLTVGQISEIPSMDPGRAPVIVGGAIIAEQALAASGRARLTVSESDILDGIALSICDH